MKTNMPLLLGAFLTTGTVMLTGCNPGGESTPSSETSDDVSQSIKAVATLEPTEGNTARGTVTFTEMDGAVRVVADITGLTPGKHGFHIHEKGDCSAADGTSAGGHFNPDNKPHGGPDSPQHHVGDLGNLTADDSGTAKLDRVFNFLTLSGPDSVMNRGVIIHSGEDDFITQPTGNAGSRVACGVILVSQ